MGRARTDAELIRASNEGEPAAFDTLFERHAAAMLRHLRPAAGPHAPDIVAETFARAWSRRARFRDLASGSARPWLMTIANNILIDAQRKAQVETHARQRLGMRLDWFVDDPFEAVDNRLSVSNVTLAAVDVLPPHEREALLLREVEGLSYDDVARHLSIKPAAARLRVSRAIRRVLRTSLENSHDR